MEFCELGDLSTFIRKRASLGDHEVTSGMIKKYPNPAIGGLNEVVSRHFLQQIASGLSWIRRRNFLHRDIKPQNLLLVPSRVWTSMHTDRQPLMADENVTEPSAGIDSLPMLKIADFGFARFLPSLQLAETLCGSPLYMAPEILRYEKYDAKADLWSTGTVLYEMMVGRPPFRAQNHVDLIAKIDKNNDRIKFPEGLAISSDMKHIIRALLKRNPVERINYDMFFQDPVVVNEIPGLVGQDKTPEPLTYNLASRTKPSKPSEGSKEHSRRNSETKTYTQDQALGSPRFQAPPQLSPRALEKRPSTSGETRPKERRPTLSGPSATAPARQHERPSSSNAHADRPHVSPSTSQLKERLDRERGRLDENTLREAREKAAQDVAFERDYVVVEKKAVEVNAFADELANSPQVRTGYRDRPLSPQGTMVRRSTTSGVPYSSTAPQTNTTRTLQIAGRQPLHQRTSSLEKQLYGRSPTSATSAITKALNRANFRIFGIGGSPPLRGVSPPQGYNPFPSYPTNLGSTLLIGDGKTVDSRDEDIRIQMLTEKLATRSDVVWGFAEVKYQQLIPIRPVNAAGGGDGASNKRASDEADDDDLTVDAIVAIAEEALVLYVNALGILARVIDVSGSWFYHKKGEGMDPSPRSAPTRSSPSAVAPRINAIVQWARNRFNDCLEKSEFVGRKLIEAQKNLPLDHPGHPSNHPMASSSSVATSVGASAENITLTSGTTAEKLMYDRALEMCRTAAINELTNEDLDGGEVSYRTAIHMLEAILDNDDDRDATGRRLTKRDDDVIHGLEVEDRAAVVKRKYHRSHIKRSTI
jgi:serine/threonine-protein kinase ULK/ATG1